MAVLPFRFPLAQGLHARPASRLQEECARFRVAVTLHNGRNHRRADCRSALALVASDTAAGDPCQLEIGAGADAAAARRALARFLEAELPHLDDDLPPVAGTAAAVPGAAGGPGLAGLAVSPGVGVGRPVWLRRRLQLPRRFAVGRRDPAAEARLFEKACDELDAALADKAARADRTAAEILRAHRSMLADPAFRGAVSRRIRRGGVPAGLATRETVAGLSRRLQESASAYLRERVADLDDLAEQLGEKLYGAGANQAPPRLPAGCVVVAAELGPSQFLALDRRRLRALVLGAGGATSHVAILARSLGVPLVAGLGAAAESLAAARSLIVDGVRGRVIPDPEPETSRWYGLEAKKLAERESRLSALAGEPGRTADGRRIEVAANVGSASEFAAAWRRGAEGIGLLRSEVLFLDRHEPPGEEEQVRFYRQALAGAGGKPVIVRTIDVGGDKPLPYLRLPAEANPFLGWRAVRFYEAHAGLLRAQLRAVLRAAGRGDLKLMVPMVDTPEEVAGVRRLLREAERELAARKAAHAAEVPLGIMVETPAAALLTDRLGATCDFFSIGSNDLLQYTMAADRGHPKLASLLDPLQPAFLRLLERAVSGARASSRWIGMCGEAAGDPRLLPLLVGLGLDELSMASTRIAGVKTRLRSLDSASCRELLGRALACTTAGEVARLLDGFSTRPVFRPVCDPGLIVLNSASRTPREAVKELCDRLELSGRVASGDALEEAVWAREAVYATDLGLGFALPHAKSPAVASPAVSFLRPRKPFPWSGKENPPVSGVILLSVPEEGTQEHLRLIASLSRRLMDDGFRNSLLGAPDVDSALALLNEALGPRDGF